MTSDRDNKVTRVSNIRLCIVLPTAIKDIKSYTTKIRHRHSSSKQEEIFLHGRGEHSLRGRRVSFCKEIFSPFKREALRLRGITNRFAFLKYNPASFRRYSSSPWLSILFLVSSVPSIGHCTVVALYRPDCALLRIC